MGKQWKQWQTLFWGAPKSLQIVTPAIKLKDACSLEEKLWLISVQSLSQVRLCNPMESSTTGLSVHHQLLEFTQTHVHWVGNTIYPSYPLSSLCPPTFNLSQHQDLFSESVLHIKSPKYWSFSFNISPSNEHSGLISFRMDWLDLLVVQRTLKSLLQHHSSKASIFQHSASFILQLSHLWLLEKP